MNSSRLVEDEAASASLPLVTVASNRLQIHPVIFGWWLSGKRSEREGKKMMQPFKDDVVFGHFRTEDALRVKAYAHQSTSGMRDAMRSYHRSSILGWLDQLLNKRPQLFDPWVNAAVAASKSEGLVSF